MQVKISFLFIILLALLTACRTPDMWIRPTDTPNRTEEPEATPTPLPAVTSTLTESPVASPTPGKVSGADDLSLTAAPTSAPTATAAQPPAPTPATPPPLAINYFNVEVEDAGAGKFITCTWETTGASEVKILAGTAQRFRP